MAVAATAVARWRAVGSVEEEGSRVGRREGRETNEREMSRARANRALRVF